MKQKKILRIDEMTKDLFCVKSLFLREYEPF